MESTLIATTVSVEGKATKAAIQLQAKLKALMGKLTIYVTKIAWLTTACCVLAPLPGPHL
eukprot:8068911-Ditylum_brightwellii.AAC.1